ncbi:hypothetical protein [Rhodopila sp.]|uniref:hypothetical protein n=1 Tax=Rhodopila sp. TaxID=2480087 RepID=UPI003D0C3B4F
MSWRFTPIERAWPFVLIARPADRRLVTGAGQTVGGASLMRVKVIGDAPIEVVEVRLDDGKWVPMVPVPGASALWEAPCDGLGEGVSVRARDARSRGDQDRVHPARPDWTPPERVADGSDQDRIDAWPEKGILNTQLGPNRNGRKW